MVFEHAIRNIVRNPGRTALSVSGIALGAMLITIIFAMTGDISQVMAGPFRALFGGEMLVLPDNASFGRLPSGYLGIKYGGTGLGQAISLQGVTNQTTELASPQELFIVNDSFNDHGARVPVIARDFTFGKGGLTVTAGQGFSAAERGQHVVLINEETNDLYPVGSEIKLFMPILTIDDSGVMRFDYSREEPISFTVIGHYRSPIPTPYISMSPPTRGPLALMPLATLREVAAVRPGWTMSAIFPEGDRTATALAKANLPTHEVMGAEQMAMALFTGARVREEEDNLLTAVSTSFTWAIFAVSALIVALTLAVALRLRRKEFAILRAQGWNRRHLQQSLLAECSLLGAAGGLLGYLLGVLLLLAVVSSAGGSITGLTGISPLNGILIALAFTAISALSSLAPVWQAARIIPAEVIRGA
jgi:ABC-type antimicrobial peptide transport system permease subunit